MGVKVYAAAAALVVPAATKGGCHVCDGIVMLMIPRMKREQ